MNNGGDIWYEDGKIYVKAMLNSAKDGYIRSLFWNDRVFIHQNIDGLKKTQGKKRSILENWLDTKKNGFVFTLEDFYKMYPKQERNKQYLSKTISRIIQNDVIRQLGNDKFELVRRDSNGNGEKVKK